MKSIVFELPLIVSKFKSGKYFYCRSDEYDLTGKSEKGFEEAEQILIDKFQDIIWCSDFEVKFKPVEKS